MATFQDIATSAGINLFSSFLFLLAFSVLRLQPQNARVFYPKWFIKGVRKSSHTKEAGRLSLSHYINLDYKAYLKMLSWMWDALLMPEEELIDHAGLDSAVFLRIFLLGLKIFVPMAGLGFLFLLPINGTDHNLASQTNNRGKDLSFSNVDKLSISNIVDKSPRLIAHLIMLYIFTIWTCAMLYMEFKIVADMRLHHLATRKRAPNQFSVLVRQVPPEEGKSVAATVEEFFQTNHPEYLLSQVAYDANHLSKALEKIRSLENWLQYYQNKYEKKPSKRPIKKLGFLGLVGEEVDAINYYTAEVERLKIEAKREQDMVLSDPTSVMPAAFVSFQSRRAAAVCAQTHQTRNPTNWITDWAPEPRDVYWPSLSIPYLSLTMRRLLMKGALFLLIFFFMIPVLGVQSLANLDGLVKKMSTLGPVVQMPFVKSLLQGFVPGLVLRIFLALLPTILMIMSKFEGHVSRSSLDRRSATKLYYFMVVNVFFGSVITGSLFEQLKMIVSSSSATNVVTSLGKTIPMKATFFITFIMVDGWAGVSMEIVRIFPLCYYHLKNMLIVKTDKDRDDAMAPGNVLLDENIPRLELYFLLGIVYSVTTPIILPFIIVFFSFGYMAYRNQVINVYDPDYDSAAAFWPHVHSRIVVAMIIEQLTLIGLFTIKGPVGITSNNTRGSTSEAVQYIRYFLSSTPFMAILPIGTLIFHFYCRRRFDPAFQLYPVEEANTKDRREKKEFPNLDLRRYLNKAYLNPVLKEEEVLIAKNKAVDSEDLENGDQEEDTESRAGTRFSLDRTRSRAPEKPSSVRMGRLPDNPSPSEVFHDARSRHVSRSSDELPDIHYDAIPTSKSPPRGPN